MLEQEHHLQKCHQHKLDEKKKEELFRMYQNLMVVEQQLTGEDRVNLGTFVLDEKYKSLKMLFDLVTVRFTKQIVHKELSERDKTLREGGLQVLMILEQELLDKLKDVEAGEHDQQTEKAMESLGW